LYQDLRIDFSWHPFVSGASLQMKMSENIASTRKMPKIKDPPRAPKALREHNADIEVGEQIRGQHGRASLHAAWRGQAARGNRAGGEHEETSGINDRADLELAERLKDIPRAESVPELVDASIPLGR
jgi:hypothetical protein